MDINTNFIILLNQKDTMTTIAAFTTVVSAALMLLQKLFMYFRAKSYSKFYNVPIELFQKGSKSKFYENLILALLLILYMLAPFVIYNLINVENRFIIFIVALNFLYGLIILLAASEGVKLKSRYAIILDVVITIGITYKFYKCISDGHNDIANTFTIYYLILFIFFTISSLYLFLISNPSLKDLTELYIIDNEDKEDLKLNIDKNSSLVILDYIDNDKMIVLECKEDKKELLLRSKYWIVEAQNIGATKKVYKRQVPIEEQKIKIKKIKINKIKIKNKKKDKDINE